ncbi:MAG TPA: oligoendopeptidase F, partial [Chloroflexia bacterium]|nr:oligoendopeptidase F [Chloroflexia bacterium]
MATKTVPSRADVAPEHKWNLEAVFPNDDQWESEFGELAPLLEKMKGFQGRLGESAGVLLDALKLRDDINYRLERLYAYARMRRDEDNTRAHYQALEDRARALWARVEEASSFFNPEVLEVGRERVDEFLAQNDDLKLYAHLLDDLFREAEHMLPAREEALLAAVGEVTAGPSQIFDMLNDADLKFGTVTDDEGEEVELSQGRYLRFVLSQNRDVRRNAFLKFHEAYHSNRNTIAATYSTQVKADIFFARARKYNSALEAALHRDNIPVNVYDNLINAVHERLPLLHRYMDMRRRALGLDELHMWDLHVPLVPEADTTIEYDRATDMVANAVAPLGHRYQDAVKEGFSSRWTDVYETQNKSSGAYSWGVYDVHPFMLLNHQDTLRDVFTLAHEVGHSIHTYNTFATQPYVYANYTLFVAEVASTLNEELLSDYLLNSSDDRAVKLAVVNHSLEQFRTTLYRQTMFAEFEKIAHEKAESGEALTADKLSEIHFDLNKKYHGAGVNVDDEIAIEWARIPHFYRSFYVYKY